MDRITKRPLPQYLASASLTLLAVGLQFLIIRNAHIVVPGLLYPSTFLIAWYFGFRQAVVSILIAVLCSDFLYYEPYFSFKVLEFQDTVRILIFAVTSTVAAWIVARGRQAERSELKTKDALSESLEVQETLNRVGKILSAELDTKKLVQSVTDASTQLSKAEFGAFFYNNVNEKGESYTLYTISGVPAENFTKFPMPRNTEIFAPTFAGSSIIRSEDITKDPRYGKNLPYHGMPEGHLPVVSYLAVPVISRSGEVIGGLFLGHRKKGIFTEREERIVTGLAAETAIAMDNARLYDRANQAIQMRDEFLSISSHELRTPLTPLKMQIQSLARHIDKGTINELGTESLKKMVSIADKQVNRITALVDDLLDVSRIASGKLNLNVEEVDLSLLVKEVIERYQHQIQSGKAQVNLHLPEKLFMKIDKLRIEQVIINLLTNALKYAPGTPVTITVNEKGADTHIKIRDEGPGIPVSDQSRIFDRFERVNSESSQTGLGLGLYIVNQIVTAHKGSINVMSSPGKGTEFNITLPVEH